MEFIREGESLILRNPEANNQVIAEIFWDTVDDNTVIANRTFVDNSLRGQGIAKKLLDAMVIEVEKEGKKIVPACSYVKKVFDEDDSYNFIDARK